MRLSIIIPARNEASNLPATLAALRSTLAQESLDDFEIVVVDDGSTDETPQVMADQTADDPRVRTIVNHGRHGYGRAVRFGLENSTGDAVVITMADASDDPADVVTYYKILRDEAECAFGSRFIHGSKLVDYPGFKLLINRGVNFVIRLMFKLRCNDVTNAFKGFRRYVIDGCQPLVSPHFNLTIEIPLKAVARGYTFKVVPVSWRNRTSGTSQLVIKEQGSRYLYTLLSVWFEWLLVGSDYHRDEGEEFMPWSQLESHEENK